MRALTFAFDDAYIIAFKVLWHSLMKTDSVPDEVPVFVLHSQTLRPDSIGNIAEFLGQYGRTATFIDVRYFVPNDLPISYHFTEAMYYRLFFSSALPEKITSLVYLDVDTIVLRSIRKLFDLQLTNSIAAVDHMSPNNAFRLWGDRVGNYFASGVLLIDIRQWRMNKQEKKFKKILVEERARLLWLDQDILNIAFENNWQRLPIWYNLCSEILSKIPESLAVENGCLFHLDGDRKPWKYYFKGLAADQWYKLYFEVFGKKFDIKAIKRPMLRRILSSVKGIIKYILVRA